MDVEGQNHREHPKKEGGAAHLSKGLKRVLTALNCLLLALGNTGGPLTLRLYFLRGGHRQWLTSWLQTGGWPILLAPLFVSYLHRRRRLLSPEPTAKLFFITRPLFLACAVLGVFIGLDDFLYACGLDFLPLSTASLLVSTYLAFTAFFAFLIVKQKFTPFSLNSVALLTAGAVLLGLHTRSDRPEHESKGEYLMGFLMTLGAAALYGLILPLVELMYAKAGQPITYTLVMEMQLVMGFFATAFCTVGMLVSKDFQAMPKEASKGEVQYYAVIVSCAIFWQFFFLGAVGVIFCVNTLLAAIIIAVFIPVTEVLAVIFFHEEFGSEKGVALALALWGLASYSYGEYREGKDKKETAPVVTQITENKREKEGNELSRSISPTHQIN